jgi:predicted nucleic acid-binding protein
MVVVDCNVLVEMQNGTRKGLAATSLLLPRERIIAPQLLYAELCSVYRKLVLRGLLDQNAALDLIGKATDRVDEFVPMEELYQEAFSESIHLRHSAYDMFYLVLARRTHATLFTFDTRLRELCVENGVECLDEIEWPYDDADDADEAVRDGEDEGSQAE